VRIGLQARTIDLAAAPANNLVFLIDVSGSMSSEDKLPLLKHALRLLVTQLRELDRVAIVVYAGSQGLVLPSTSGAEKIVLLEALERLHAGGSTAGAAGLRLAYDVARKSFIEGGNNRVILATDGDFNVGVTSNAELERMIETRREEGTALTVLGFGAGNIKDDRMEMLADKGNGNYAYIDSPLEARKVLVQEFGGTLVTVAKDVKLQVEFNPAVVAGYRLIGYENRVLADEDFTDDKKDAGDMGAGHSVTALYEIIPVGTSDARRVRTTGPRRYLVFPAARPAAGAEARPADELMYVKLRYKAPTDSVSVPMEVIVPNRVTAASEEFRFVQAVAAFGMTLRASEYRGNATAAMSLELAGGALGADPHGYRSDFIDLVRSYERLRGVAEAPKR
jgi:Ca-activated chloride channel family protein